MQNAPAAFIALAGAALVANLSAFVWGPNLVLLISPTRPIQRSIAYLLGRGLVLTVASVAIVASLFNAGVGAGRLESFATQFTHAPEPWKSAGVGVVIVLAAAWLWRRPPGFLGRGGSVSDGAQNVGKARLWVSFALGIGILFANLLEFAWQGIAFGGLVARTHDVVFLSVAVVVWTVVGTADLWAATLVRGVGGKWATERFRVMTEKLPNIQPWQVFGPLMFVGAGFIVYGILVWLAE